jgi:enediyne biosynthesis thioesterase
MSRAYEYRHVVGFEETNVVGNVYFTAHRSGQCKCREMFLREHAMDVVRRLGPDGTLVTVRCACEYHAELGPLEEVVLRMYLEGIVQNRIKLRFEHYRVGPGGEELVARSMQEVASMRREDGRMVPAAIPDQLREALRAYEAP